MSKIVIRGECRMKFTVVGDRDEEKRPICEIEKLVETFPTELEKEMISNGMTTCDISNFTFSVVEEN